MKFKGLLLALFCLFFGVSVAFSEVTYYVTDKQLNELTNQINNLKNNNESMRILLENQNREFQILESNYMEQYLTMNRQQKNYQELLSRYESRNSIYKYGIVGALVVGFVLGVVVAK